MNRLSRSGLILVMLVGLLLPGSASAQQTEPQQPALRLIETSAAGLVFELDIPAPTLEDDGVGIGAAGTALLGMVLLGEPATAARIACIALIVAGVLGLKLVG